MEQSSSAPYMGVHQSVLGVVGHNIRVHCCFVEVRSSVMHKSAQLGLQCISALLKTQSSVQRGDGGGQISNGRNHSGGVQAGGRVLLR